MFDLPSFDEIKTAQPVRPAPVEKKRVLTPIKAITPEKKLKTAGYCRVSTNMEEQRSSIEIQQKHFLTMVNAHDDWEFCGLFCDIVSGTKSETRPGLQRMLVACEKGEINLILTKSISRFARNTTDLLEMVRSLTATGAGIIFDREHIDTRSMESEFLLSILASLAEDESHSISSNCRWAMQRRFQDGSYKISTAPYGYDLIDGSLVVNEAEAAVVRLIFEQYVRGISMNVIADDLNGRGIPTKRAGEIQNNGHVVSGRWSAAIIGKLIQNEAYTGDFVMQKTYKDEAFKVHRNRGERKQYYSENHHPAIISRETFRKANEIRLQWPAARKQSRRSYDLTSRLVCGYCGCNLRRSVSATGTVFWVCRAHRKHADACPLPPMSEKEILISFGETVTEQDVKIYRAGITEEWRRTAGPAIKDMEKRLAGIEEELSRLTATGADTQMKRNRLRAEQTELQSRLEKMKDNRITETEELLQLIKCWDGSSLIFPLAVEKAVVYGRDRITFYLRCGLEASTEAEQKSA